MEIIIREGRSERRDRIYGRSLRSRYLQERGVEGIARNAEEAADIAYHELRDKEKAGPIVCEGGPEKRQALIDDMKRIGQDPERVERQWREAGIIKDDA